MRLKGKGILITGGNQGLGKAIAEACLAEGADLFLCARDFALLQKTERELLTKAAWGQKVLIQAADVSRPEEVKHLIETVRKQLPHLDGLVNNAGVYGPMGSVEEIDWEAWAKAIEVNLLGTVLMCRAVLPIFKEQGRGKIINLSGGGATAPLPRFSAYAASKAAVVRFTETLAEETKGTGIDVNAVAPGALNTRLLDEVLTAGPEKVGEVFYRRSLKQKEEGGAPLKKGAELCLFLLSDKSSGISGRLISAVWDPWERLDENRAALMESDIYTLRRIVPKDRGQTWGGE